MYSKILYHLDKVDRLERGEVVPPVSCEIDPTNACQNSCNFCISKDRKPAEMEWAFYLDLTNQLREVGVKSIVFVGGGEPTLHPLFNRMAAVARDLGFKLGLITDGIELHTVPVEKFEYIRVSLDAGSAETYTSIKGTDYFDQVVANIRKMRPRCKTLGLNYVICDQTADDILAAEMLAEELEVDYIHFKPVLEKRDLPAMPPILQYEKSFYSECAAPHPKGCMIAALAGTVTADGKYIYCCQHRYDPAFTIADLKQESLASAIEKRAAMEVDISSCAGCRYYGYYEAYRQVKRAEGIYDYHRDFI